jgi:hypothetical protein
VTNILPIVESNPNFLNRILTPLWLCRVGVISIVIAYLLFLFAPQARDLFFQAQNTNSDLHFSSHFACQLSFSG